MSFLVVIASLGPGLLVLMLEWEYLSQGREFSDDLRHQRTIGENFGCQGYSVNCSRYMAGYIGKYDLVTE